VLAAGDGVGLLGDNYRGRLSAAFSRDNAMPVKTKRWNDPAERDDGYRLLICRYRPRGVPKKKETWDNAAYVLGPSRRLHADFYGKSGPPITWDVYRKRYLEEMEGPEQRGLIEELADLVAEGKTITLLCSSACVDANHCHRTLLEELVNAEVARRQRQGQSA
jgi:uncharacterized protein YeaO (DUF488 family)